MKKIILFALFISSILIADVSLKGKQKTINVATNTIDIKKVLLEVGKKVERFDFKGLKNKDAGVKNHIERITISQKNLKELARLRSDLEVNYLDIKSLQVDLDRAKKNYDREINKIYKKNSSIDRYSYILVAYKGEQDYKNDLENFIIDKFAIKKYDQTTTLKKSLASVAMQSIIKTEKDFGQKAVDTVYDYIIRANNVTLKVLKITQNPFIKSENLSIKNNVETKDFEFKESAVTVIDLASQDFTILKNELEAKFEISTIALKPFMENLQNKINLDVYRADFEASSKKIVAVLTSLEAKHNEQTAIVATIQSKLNIKKGVAKLIESKLDKLLAQTQKLLKPYNIPLTRETIGVISIVTPKLYSEAVDLNEEKEYINRKVKSYISKLNVSDLKQSETLIDYSDLTSTTKKKHKSIKFETVHFLPYLDKNNQIGLFLFASISIKEELDDDDILEFKFKYDTVKFIPIKKGYKTLFVAQKEVTLGIVKEFLESNSFKKSFDQYCIDESYLPEEAKNYKKVSQEFYQYPAVCFKVDNIQKFISWVSKKTKRDIVIPNREDWAYVASNSKTTNYCWGNMEPEELIEEDSLPENIYIEGIDLESTITKTASYPKSLNGFYDMCGNVFELVLEDGDLAYKGNSFSSYIEKSTDEAERYSDDINSNLGLRLFYIKDLTNE